MVDDRRLEEPGELARARHRERRAAQLVGRERARRGRARRGRRSRWRARRRTSVHAADDGDDEPVVGLDGDADVVAVEVDDRVAVEARVQLRELGERLGAGLARRSRRRRSSGTSSKSHSSTQVTGGTSRCARAMCSAIRRRTPRSGSRRPSPAAPAAARTSSSVIRPPGPCPRPRRDRRRAPARSGARPASPARAQLRRLARRRRSQRRHVAVAGGGTAASERTRLARLADDDELGADRGDLALGDEDPAARSRRTATGSRRSPCRSGSRRAGRPRRSPGPPATSQRATSPSVRPSPRSGSLNELATHAVIARVRPRAAQRQRLPRVHEHRRDAASEIEERRREERDRGHVVDRAEQSALAGREVVRVVELGRDRRRTPRPRRRAPTTKRTIARRRAGRASRRAARAPHVSAKSATTTTWTSHSRTSSDCRLAKRVVREYGRGYRARR